MGSRKVRRKNSKVLQLCRDWQLTLLPNMMSLHVNIVGWYFLLDSPPPLSDLVNELQEVTDWFYLGMCLRVPLATLMNIRESHGNVEAYRREMLDAWMKEENPTWSKVVTALKEMKLTALAKRLASKFGNCFSLLHH